MLAVPRTGLPPVTTLADLGGAPLASPAFTGVPTAPTAAPGTNTTQLATTAFAAAADALKAPLASPALTGVPTAPTAAAATNTTQLATCAFVRTEVSNLVASSPAALDTLDELATALGDDPNFATTVTNALAAKAPLESPTLTGTPTAPTAAPGTDTTQVATTAFVAAAIAALPAPVVRYQVPLTWGQNDIVRNQTDVVLAFRGSSGGATTQWKAPAAGTITRVTTHINETITQDTLTIDVFVNGVSANVDMAHTSGAFSAGGTQACSVAIAAGDLITITITTGATLNPHITPDMNVWLTVEE